LGVQERIIRKSQLDWTIVRPTILTNGLHTGAYRVWVDRDLSREPMWRTSRCGGFPRQAGRSQ
jgi:hypothetical protein